MTTVDCPGPTGLLLSSSDLAASREDIVLAAESTAGYSDGRNEPVVRVEVRYAELGGVDSEILSVAPGSAELLRTFAV